MTAPQDPPPRVIDAFGAIGDVVHLPGGAGSSVLIGEVVLKPIDDPIETAWVQGFADRLEPDGFRVALPTRSAEGAWVVDGWCANEFIGGLEPLAPAWDQVVEVGLRFSGAADTALDGSETALAGRTHRWAIADRVAWGEAGVELGSEASQVLDQLRQLLGTADQARVLIHGDLTSNVLVDRTETPVVLDISPYLRPARWASAIVVADAVLWNGADLDLVDDFIRSPTERDLFGRALVFRMVAEQLADDPRHGALLPPYRMVIDRLS